MMLIMMPSCFGTAQKTRFYLYPFSSLAIKPASETTVTVQGRPELSVLISSDDYEEDGSSNLYRARFNMEGLQDGRSYIFRVTNYFYPTISFPFSLDDDILLIGGLDTSLYSAITDSARTDFSVVFKTSGAGTIVGAVNPLDMGLEICGPRIDQISLVDNSTLETLTDPDIAFFYFSSTGTLSTFFKTGFEDFVFFNVPEGNYKIKYYMSSAGETFYSDVVVVENNVSFGFQLPCQTFREFRSAYE